MAALFGAFLNAYDHGDEAVNSGAGSFSDADGIADYAQEGVELCWRLRELGEEVPLDTLTVEECAQALRRWASA